MDHKDKKRMEPDEREDPDVGSIGDPTAEWSADGTIAYSATLANCSFGCDMWFWYSLDYGKSWKGPIYLDNNGDADKPMIHVDKSPTSPYKDRLYILYDLPGSGNTQVAGYSTDHGKSWTQVNFPQYNPGVGGDLSTDINGYLYYVYPAFSERNLQFLLSKDGGNNFTNMGIISSTNGSFQMSIPAQDQRRALIYTVVETDQTNGKYRGSIYVSWADTVGTDGNGWDHAYLTVAHSRNQGKTWTLVHPVSLKDVQQVDRFFQWMSIDPKSDGRLHLSFYDTRHWADNSGVDVYYTYSDDGGVTWIEPIRVTSASSFNVYWDFDQFGDYEGLNARGGRVLPIWADNRNRIGPVTVWTAVINETVLANCHNFNVSYSVSPLPIVAGKKITFTAEIAGGSGAYTYEWHFQSTAQVDCSTATCTWTFTEAIHQASLFAVDSKTGCYKGATAFVVPKSGFDDLVDPVVARVGF